MTEANLDENFYSKFNQEVEKIKLEKKQIDLKLEKIISKQKEIKNERERISAERSKLIAQMNEIKKDDKKEEIDWKTIGLIAGGLLLVLGGGGGGSGWGVQGGKCGTRSAGR